ncbi:MAG: hypothetical protein ACYSYU_11410 [Planctomycetota bacterium]
MISRKFTLAFITWVFLCIFVLVIAFMCVGCTITPEQADRIYDTTMVGIETAKDLTDYIPGGEAVKAPLAFLGLLTTLFAAKKGVGVAKQRLEESAPGRIWGKGSKK